MDTLLLCSSSAKNRKNYAKIRIRRKFSKSQGVKYESIVKLNDWPLKMFEIAANGTHDVWLWRHL